MPEPVKVNVVSYGGVKPGQIVAGNTKEGEKTTIFDAATSDSAAYMFYGRDAMTSWNVELTNLKTGNYMFCNCTSLYTFSSGLPKLENGANMFYGCNLSAESVKNVLSTIPDRAAAGLAVAMLTIGKRTHFKTDPDVKALLGETGAEITAKTYRCKGWDVVVQN